MERINLLIELFDNMPVLQLVILIIVAIIWFFGMSYLMKKHRQRLKQENIEFKENIQLQNITAKEWFVFSVFALTTFGVLICVVNI